MISAAEQQRLEQMLAYERELWASGLTHIAGVDEAGRGPLAGPVVAGAVILPLNCRIPELNDSKQLRESVREKLFEQIQHVAIAIGVGIREPADIDLHNIYQATRLAMIDAVAQLPVKPQHVLIDGKPFRTFPHPCTAIVKGDAKSASIAAASIIAKVTRDRIMQALHLQFPAYDFAQHKGYPTPAHFAALKQHGPSPVHRRSFRGVKEFFATSETQAMAQASLDLGAAGVVDQ